MRPAHFGERTIDTSRPIPMIYEPYQLLSIGLLVTMIGTVEKREDARCVTKYQASLRAKSHTQMLTVFMIFGVCFQKVRIIVDCDANVMAA